MPKAPRIFVVEDDESIRMLLEVALRSSGYTVSAFPNAADALAEMENTVPDAAVLDPRMTETLPPRITAATGFDALVHAIEAATCLQRNPVSDACAEKAMAQIVRALPRAVQNGKDRKARMVMANGSLLAGRPSPTPWWGWSTPSATPWGACATWPTGRL